MRKTIRIKGMHCESCEILLKESLEDAGVKVISANHKKGELVVDMKDDKVMPTVKKAVESEGYSLA